MKLCPLPSRPAPSVPPNPPGLSPKPSQRKRAASLSRLVTEVATEMEIEAEKIWGLYMISYDLIVRKLLNIVI